MSKNNSSKSALSRSRKRAAKRSPRGHIISFFCGPGGLDEGFRNEGFQTIFAVDVDLAAANTFKKNHPHSKVTCKDLKSLSAVDILARIPEDKVPIGVLGGPPCQSFSISNVHSKSRDIRHSLPTTYASLLQEINKNRSISFFVFENVPGLKSKKHIRKYKNFLKSFKKAGFKLFETELNAVNYGVAQNRKRIFIIGINKKLYKKADWKSPRRSSKSNLTVKDLIANLPEPISFSDAKNCDEIPFHPNHWCMTPKSKKFGKKNNSSTMGRSFRRLNWNKPSWTVAYGNREVHVHPDGKRRLSVFEAMRLQSFPDSYVISGTLSDQIRLVSEAVPPKLAASIARSIKLALDL